MRRSLVSFPSHNTYNFDFHLILHTILQRLSEEAQLCIQDVMESLETDYFEEELHCAEVAVGNAGIAYSELLEELALTNEGVQLLNEVRKVVAPAIESLREELRSIGKLKSKEA